MALWERGLEHLSLPFAMTRRPRARGQRLLPDGWSGPALETGHGVKSAFPLPASGVPGGMRKGGLPPPGGAEAPLNTRTGTGTGTGDGGGSPAAAEAAAEARRARSAAGWPAGARCAPAVAKHCNAPPPPRLHRHPSPPPTNERRGRLPRWPMRGRGRDLPA